MLRSEELDRQSFEDIMKTALLQISHICPQWTNFNPSDPGVTIVELLACLTETQQFHLNVIGDAHRLRYLKLLGEMPQKAMPAKTYIKITASDREIPQGTAYMADDIQFETTQTFTAVDNDIVALKNDISRIENCSDMLDDMLFYPFGRDEAVSAFQICLKKPPKAGCILSFYVEIKLPEHCGEITDEFAGFVHLETDSSYTIVSDETSGFSRNGTIRIRVERPIISVGGSYPVEIFIKDGEYPIKPALTRVVLNVIPAVQKKTYPMLSTGVPERYIGSALGVCNFSISWDMKDILPETLVIGVMEKDGMHRWERVDDFDDSEPDSRHFLLKDGKLVFGSGEKGMPPEGGIYMLGCAVSKGDAGNIKAKTVDFFEEKTASCGVNITPSTGGRSAETIDQCFERLRRQLSVSERCVTLADFEQAVRRTPGVPVYRVKAFCHEQLENCIMIAVENNPDSSRLSQCCLEHMRRYISPRVMTGTKVEFTAPEYVGIYVCAELMVSRREGVLKQIEKYIEDFFRHISFGETISISALNKYIRSVPWIDGVKSLDVSFSGGGAVRLENDDIKLKKSSLPRLERTSISLCGR